MRELQDRMDEVRAAIEGRLDLDQEWQLFDALRLEREHDGAEATVVDRDTSRDPNGDPNSDAVVIELAAHRGADLDNARPDSTGAGFAPPDPAGWSPRPRRAGRLGTASAWAQQHRSVLWVAAALVVALFVGSAVLFGHSDRTEDAIVIDGTSAPTPAPSTTVDAPDTQPQVVDISPPPPTTAAPVTVPPVTNSPKPSTTTSSTTSTSTIPSATTTTVAPPKGNDPQVPDEPKPNTTTTTLGPGPVGEPKPSPGIVNYSDPPPPVTLRPLGTVASLATPAIAVGDLGVAVQSPTTDGADGVITVFGFDGSTRKVVVKGSPTLLGYGPGDVAYVRSDGVVAAVPLAGPRQGTVIDAGPGGGAVPASDLEPIFVGHGPTGLFDRRSTQPAPKTFVGYVDEVGGPRTLAVNEPRTPQIRAQSRDEVRIAGAGGIEWDLRINRSPDWKNWWRGQTDATGISHDPPAPAVFGNSVFWTQIGPWSSNDATSGYPTQWVIAQLQPFGLAQWYSIPNGWQVAGSDYWGTVVFRRTSAGTEIALAELLIIAASE